MYWPPGPDIQVSHFRGSCMLLSKRDTDADQEFDGALAGQYVSTILIIG